VSKAQSGCGNEVNPNSTVASADVSVRFLPNGCLPKALVCDGCCNPAEEDGEPQSDGSCCYYHCTGSCCGRPFLVAGQARVAASVVRADWVDAAAESGNVCRASSRALGVRIANEWLTDAAMEHASVAAFARFTLELLAFGAPSELVEDSQRAGLDEVRHARACYTLAARFEGVARGPGALDLTGAEPAPSLRECTRRTFSEGCIGETEAALCAQRALDVTSDPRIRELLAQIVEDETRHAELAWRFVAWALQRDPSIASAVYEAQHEALQRVSGEPVEHESRDVVSALHAAGRLTQTERALAAQRAVLDVVVLGFPRFFRQLCKGNQSAPDANSCFSYGVI
jgi:hypothetical protein